MDKTLADFYGTNAPDESDVEKLAAAEAAEVLAGEKGVNLEGMSDDAIEAMAQKLLADDGEESDVEASSEAEDEETPAGDEEDSEAAAVEEPGTEKLSAAEEKLQEADYLGRVMAHAFVHETKDIEKKAAAEQEKTAAKGGSKVLSHLKGLGSKAKGMAGKVGEKAKAVGSKAHAQGKKGLRMAKKHPGMSHGAAGVAGAAAGVTGMKAMEKKSSAVDQLVQARVQEILELNNIDPASLEKVSEAEAQETDAADILAQTIEQKAWEVLAQHGLTPAEETPAEE